MFKKILIANRGEIALRVICACKELGIRTVAIYSEADRNSLHVRFADEAICIGPPQLAQSYLNIPSVISAAEIANVDAIHPGYGLLAENANFAEVAETCNIKFIGPPPEITRLMGEKEKARAAMKSAGVPILPGSEGILASDGEAMEWAEPGRLSRSSSRRRPAAAGAACASCAARKSFPRLFKAASSEAAAAFGNGDLYMEKFVERPRHIEFQILADQYGNVASLGERECSIQRRHQKLLEESPSTQVSPGTARSDRQVLCKTLSDIGYVNAGTIEFLMDEDRKLYFIEMNTRIQVEHPVTEMVTDVDLVKSQILLAAGERLENVLHGPILHRGHAIECRINAEHPEKFTPSAGRITTFNPPGGTGVRIDTAAYAEGVIPPYYDSLIAKLIVRGKDRAEAVSRMSRALEMFIIEGIYTTIPLHRRILADPDFRAGNCRYHVHRTISGKAARPKRPSEKKEVAAKRLEVAPASGRPDEVGGTPTGQSAGRFCATSQLSDDCCSLVFTPSSTVRTLSRYRSSLPVRQRTRRRRRHSAAISQQDPATPARCSIRRENSDAALAPPSN